MKQNNKDVPLFNTGYICKRQYSNMLEIIHNLVIEYYFVKDLLETMSGVDEINVAEYCYD